MYKKFRDVHLYLGLIVLAPILVVSASGVLIGHKDLFGLKPAPKPKKEKGEPSGELTAVAGAWTSSASSIDRAIDEARQTWGRPVALDRIELKDEPGMGLVVKVKAAKTEYVEPEEIIWSVASAEVMEMPHQHGWGKFFDDLHTGKAFGRYGFLSTDMAAIAMLVLSASGVVLWLIPIFKKRAKKVSKKAAAPAVLVTANSDA